jgi:hypothetical protein
MRTRVPNLSSRIWQALIEATMVRINIPQLNASPLHRIRRYDLDSQTFRGIFSYSGPCRATASSEIAAGHPTARTVTAIHKKQAEKIETRPNRRVFLCAKERPQLGDSLGPVVCLRGKTRLLNSQLGEPFLRQWPILNPRVAPKKRPQHGGELGPKCRSTGREEPARS